MRRNYALVGLIMLFWFVISFITNIIGPLIPDIIDNFHLQHLALAGFIPTSFFVAYGIMSIPSGLLIERFSQKTVLTAGFALPLVGSLLFALVPTFPVLLASSFTIGLGMAMLQTTINPLTRVAGGEENFAFFSVMGQLVFGAASFVSPLVYARLVARLTSGETLHGLTGWLQSLTPASLPWVSLYWLFAVILVAVIIVVLGVVDDIMALPAKLKFVIQIVAALIPALNGVSIQALSNPNIFSPNAYWVLNWLSVPITVLWIVGITNAVNLIDGLDGLANGVSAISAATVLVIALICSEAQVAVVMAALVGACVGFLPYNLNPAKMFMGDTGATFLGFILSTMSIQGLFKFYAVISFAVPFLILGLPIFDTAFAMIRRMAHGQSPMHADRGHIHHRLIDMGLNQKQAVATLYVISGILGLSAVVLTTGGEAKAMLLLIALCVVAVVAARVVFPKEVKEELHEELEELTELGHHEEKDKQKEDGSHE